MSDQPTSIAKSAASFLSGTMLSRVTGLVRDMSMAFCFGTSASIAAFIVALRFAILLRRLLGEGALLNGFVPHFETERKEDPKKGAEFFRDVFFSTFFLLIGLIVMAEFVLKLWLPHEIISLVMLILPGIPFICLFGICSGLLHCEKYFFLSGVAPVAYNLIWICAVWLYRHEIPEVAAVGLSISISVAFLFQWLMTFPKTVSYARQFLTWKELFSARLFSKEIRVMFASLSLGVIGVAAAQINTAIDTLFARFACLEGPAYLNYAIHLQQLPLALFGIGVSSALLPPLSRAFAAGDPNQSKSLLDFALSKTMMIIVPASVATFVLGSSSINLLFGRGDFSSLSAAQTTYCLWGYGLGLVPMVITLLIAPTFYAKKDYRTPTFCSLISIGAGLVLNFLFIVVLRWGPATLAYSTSAAAFLNMYLLIRRLPFAVEWRPAIASTIAALLAGALTLVVGIYVQDPTMPLVWGMEASFASSFAEQVSQFFLLFGTFAIAYTLLSLCLRR
jgi:putative peptidoglycan lipid II flippase